MTGKLPVRVGVTIRLLSPPGRRPASGESSGTQNEWMTSFAVMSSFVCRPFGMRQVPVGLPVRVRERPGELLRHDLDDERVVAGVAFCASTIALTIEIAVTRMAGIAVQTISSWVCPCVGGPSESRPA